jgi:hypothetical protein
MWSSFKYIWIFVTYLTEPDGLFFTYLTKPDGLSVAKYFYCDELSVAKTSNKLFVAKARAMDSPLLKMKSVAVYIQRRLQ